MKFTATRIALIAASLSSSLGMASGQQPAQSKSPKATSPPSGESLISQALTANPVTAPYPIQVGKKDGRIVLSGRVGTKEIHDTALRVAMAVSPSIDDRLVIDTGEVYRTLSTPNQGVGVRAPVGFVPSPYLYPPPLFGRVDEPFLGFEPPIISYPPWWNAVKARRGDPYGAPVLDPYSPIGEDPGPGDGQQPPPRPVPAVRSDSGPAVEMTLDPRGVAVLRGSVPTNEARIGIGQKVARMEGVKEVVNQLEVEPATDGPQVPIRPRDVPPPPPTPEPEARPPAPVERANPAPAPAGALQPRADAIDQRLAQAMERRPALRDLHIKAEVHDGIATLSGSVPTVFEAMMAFRAAQQTVGVGSVVDHLEFSVPDGQKPNPLITKGRPDDVEPYLEAQMRRQVADRAQIDRVRVVGDRLELKGTITRSEDRAGVEAVLRSMPLLRGFVLDAKLVPE